MRRWRWVLVAALVVACGESDVGEGPSDPTVELFGEGAISTEAPEFAIAFTPDGDTAFFNRTPLDRSRLDLMVSVRVDGRWADATLFEPTAGFAAIDPFMSDSGRLYFSSDWEGQGLSGSFDLWYVDRTPDGWSSATVLPPPINTDSSDVFNSFTSDGVMAFSSRRDGVRRVYATHRSGEGWSEPELQRFGGTDAASNPAIARDGSFIVVATNPTGGPSDLHVSCATDTGWSDLIVLPEPINSPFGELAPALASDWLYFTSERPGIVGPQPEGVRPPGDIYRTATSYLRTLCD